MANSVKIRDTLLPSDLVALQEKHQLIRDDAYDENNSADWKVRLARRYYNKLFREFAIIDLSQHLAGKYGLRWRTESEVLSGKGQTRCGSISCENSNVLNVYEMPFKYSEHGQIKRELIKVCVCSSCSPMLRTQKGMGSSSSSEPTKRKLKDNENSSHKQVKYGKSIT
jgi:hypothetical protein